MSGSIEPRRRSRVRPAVLAVLLIALAVTTPQGTVGAGETAGLTPTPYSGLIAVYASREAARSRQLGDFWNRIAGATGEPAGDFADEAAAAMDELQGGLATIELQFERRYSALGVLGGDAYDPAIVPSQFTADVTNIHFPLVPGRTLVYEGLGPEGLERHEVTVLETTRTIDGVVCREVRTLETLAGEVRESLVDWYAQDQQGNVWHFGRCAQHLTDGFIDGMEGSWRAGVRQALPGIVKPVQPLAGQSFRQELAVNVAESMGSIVDVGTTATLGIGTYVDCIEIEESNFLEPDEEEHRIYAPAIGLVRETDAVTGQSLDLIQITTN